MRALMGALPATGTAELAGTDLLSLPPHRRIAQGIGYMPEDRRLVPEFTAEENIRLPSWAAKFPDVAQRLDWIFASCRKWRACEEDVLSNSLAASRRWWRWRAH